MKGTRNLTGLIPNEQAPDHGHCTETLTDRPTHGYRFGFVTVAAASGGELKESRSLAVSNTPNWLALCGLAWGSERWRLSAARRTQMLPQDALQGCAHHNKTHTLDQLSISPLSVPHSVCARPPPAPSLLRAFRAFLVQPSSTTFWLALQRSIGMCYFYYHYYYYPRCLVVLQQQYRKRSCGTQCPEEKQRVRDE